MTSIPARIEAAIARLDALPDGPARAAAQEALSAVLELHADGLGRLHGWIRGAGAEGERILRAAASDEVVASLLLLHDLHPAASPDDRDGPGAGRVEAPGPEPQGVEGGLVPVERLVRRRSEEPARCDLCAQPLPSAHDHVFDVEGRALECACTACALLFDTQTTRKRRVRSWAVALEGLRIEPAQWDELGVPVGLVFFSRSSSLGEVVAAYPGPRGAVESTVPRAAWSELVEQNPILGDLEPDTAALLVDRTGTVPRYLLLSIDHCFRLTGLVRSRWEGMTGGKDAARAVDELLGELAEGRS